jgi:6-hydroxymethylpterin diphosphokinase MptE-like
VSHPTVSEKVQLEWELRDVEPLSFEPQVVEPPGDGVEVCYLLGVAGAESLLGWLDGSPERHLAVIESEPGHLLCFKPRHPRLHLRLPKHVEELTATFAGKRSDLLVSPGTPPDEALYLQLVGAGARSTTLIDEFRRMGDLFYENFYANLLELPGRYAAAGLRGKFEGVPAIICGAGPSLDRNAHLLSELSDRALIFAGGSALNALSNRGICPHFGAGLDPHPAQVERILTNSAFELPMFFRGRWAKQILPILQGPGLYLGGAGGYPIADWFDERLGIPQLPVDEGFNVIHLCIGIARQLGCSPIVLVGMDLALTDDRLYADHIVEDPRWSPETFYDAPIERPGIDGRPVRTLWKWVAESEWIGAQPNLINATEGGLGMPGVPNQPLASLSWGPSRPLEEEVHRAIQSSPLSVTREQILEACGEVRESLIRVRNHLEKLENLSGGVAALHQVEMEEELAHQHILAPLSMVEGIDLKEAVETNLRFLP